MPCKQCSNSQPFQSSVNISAIKFEKVNCQILESITVALVCLQFVQFAAHLKMLMHLTFSKPL
eukprot:c54776_g1_i1 orf=230-418(+)